MASTDPMRVLDPADPFFSLTPTTCDPAMPRLAAVRDKATGAVLWARDAASTGFSGSPTITMRSGAADKGGTTITASSGLSPIMSDGSAGPLLKPGDLPNDGSGLILNIPPRFVPHGSASIGVLPGNPASQAAAVVAGNTLVALVAYDPTGGVGIASVKLVDADTTQTSLTIIGSALTVGGTSGHKLAIYALQNAPGRAASAGSVVKATFSGGDPNYVALSVMEVSTTNGASAYDVQSTGTGSDAVPTTNPTNDTGSALTVVISALLVAGNNLPTVAMTGAEGWTDDYAPAVAPEILPADRDVDGNRPWAIYAGSGSFTLFVYRQNLTAIGQCGFAASLPESRDWAVITTAFK